MPEEADIIKDTGSDSVSDSDRDTRYAGHVAEKKKPHAPSKDVRKKQDPEYSPADFDRDLEKATRRLDRPSERAPKSSKK